MKFIIAYTFKNKDNPKQTLSTLEYDDAGNTLDIKSGFGYNGEKLDETGNIYLRARYYNPRIGQFVQIDSNRGDQQSIASQQRYTYVANNQYKYVDSNGNIFGFIKKAVNTVVNTAKKVVKAVVDVGKKVVNAVINTGKKIVEEVVNRTKISEVIKKNVPDKPSKTDNGKGKNSKTTANKASNTKEKAPEPESCPFKDFLAKHGNGIFDAMRFIIDFAGMLLPPGASTVLDIINALIYLLRDKPIDFIVSVASIVIVGVGGYVFKTLKAAGKFDKIIAGIVKINSSAKQLITSGLTRANNFVQAIAIPFTRWVKDAFGTIISKAKGFIREMFEKYGPKSVQYAQTPEGVKIPIVQEIKGEATEAVTKKVIKVSNMSEFFKTEFGKKIKNSVSKTAGRYHGQTIYRVDKKTNKYLKKGYYLYLDATHYDHLEVFDSIKQCVAVLNLDGSYNAQKSASAIGRRIKW